MTSAQGPSAEGGPAPRRALLVAAAGGHLQQLWQLSPRLFPATTERVWVTFDNAQSRSLLADERVEYVRYPAPRDVVTNVKNLDVAFRLLKNERFDVAVSTGSSVALTFLPAAAARGITSHYIESVTRFDGPSATGKVLRRIPGMHLYCQHKRWSDQKWRYRGSVLDGFEVVEQPSRAVDKIVVTLGSAQDYPFTRLLRRLVEIIPAGVEVLWQTGPTPTDGLGIDARQSVPSQELESAMAEADVVIAHAGAGSAITALNAGRIPVLVPRKAASGEHIDDHQLEIARVLSERGLAVVAEADELTWENVLSASRLGAARGTAPPPFKLDE